MNKHILLAFCVFFGLLYSVQGQVKHGTEVELDQKPKHTVLVKKLYQQKHGKEGRIECCGGIIINEFWVATAAHCFKSNIFSGPHRMDLNEEVQVIAGDVWFFAYQQNKQNRQEKTSIHWAIHPNFDDADLTVYNIALAKVLDKFDFNQYVQPALISNHLNQLFDNHFCQIFGWGQRQDNQPQPYSLRLLKAEVKIMKENKGTIEFGKNGRSLEPEQGHTYGDSGGPLICNFENEQLVVGLISNGPTSFSDIGKPGNFEAATKIFPYLDWMAAQVNLMTPSQPIQLSPMYPGQVPHFVVLLYFRYSVLPDDRTTVLKCHGALIDKNWVITSAVCFGDYDQRKLRSITAVAGLKTVASVDPWTVLRSSETSHTSTHWFKHKFVENDEELYDVGLIYFSKGFDLSPYGRSLSGTNFAGLPGQQLTQEDSLRLTYWQLDGDDYKVEKFYQGNDSPNVAELKTSSLQFKKFHRYIFFAWLNDFLPFGGILHDDQNKIFGVKSPGEKYKINFEQQSKKYFAIEKEHVNWVRRCMHGIDSKETARNFDRECKRKNRRRNIGL